MLAGLLAVLTGTLAVLAARRGIAYRAPDSQERDDITQPLARIMVRHLPMDAIGPDLADFAEFGAATHTYLLEGGPLLQRLTPDPGEAFNEFEENE